MHPKSSREELQAMCQPQALQDHSAKTVKDVLPPSPQTSAPDGSFTDLGSAASSTNFKASI